MTRVVARKWRKLVGSSAWKATRCARLRETNSWLERMFQFRLTEKTGSGCMVTGPQTEHVTKRGM